MTVEDIKNYLKEKERILHNEYIESLEHDDSLTLTLSHQVNNRTRLKLIKEIINDVNAMEGEN